MLKKRLLLKHGHHHKEICHFHNFSKNSRFFTRSISGTITHRTFCINLENYPDKVDSHSLQQYNRPLLHDDVKALNARCEVHESLFGPSEKLYFIRIQNKLSSLGQSTEIFSFRLFTI